LLCDVGHSISRGNFNPRGSRFAHPFQKFSNVYHRSTHGSTSDFPDIIVRRHANRIETPVERLDNGFRPNRRPNPAGGTMLYVDGRADGNFICFAIRLQSVECSCLHEADHVRCGIYGRQGGVMRRERVPELDSLLRFAARSDGDGLGHASMDNKDNKETLTNADEASDYAVGAKRIASIASSARHSA
jgi:hypothetical protein